jgi:hypothetical protein
VNHADLSAQIAKNRKVQMLKKAKEDKEKKREIVVRQVAKASKPAKAPEKKANADLGLGADQWFEIADDITGDQAFQAPEEDMEDQNDRVPVDGGGFDKGMSKNPLAALKGLGDKKQATQVSKVSL